MTEFFSNKLTAKSLELFSQKCYIIDVRLGHEYASGIVKSNIFSIYTHFNFTDTNLQTWILKPVLNADTYPPKEVFSKSPYEKPKNDEKCILFILKVLSFSRYLTFFLTF